MTILLFIYLDGTGDSGMRSFLIKSWLIQEHAEPHNDTSNQPDACHNTDQHFFSKGCSRDVLDPLKDVPWDQNHDDTEKS